MPITCQPDQIHELVPLPPEVYFMGIDSGVRHAVSGASYGEVRAAAFMGYTLAALAHGATPSDLAEARRSGRWSSLPFGGYLANISPADFEEHVVPRLPSSISGAEFLEQYGPSLDEVAPLLPDRMYRVLACASHPVYEQFRVRHFLDSLEALNAGKASLPSELRKMGRIMYESHGSYTEVGLGNEQTDRLVELVQQAGPEAGLYGAKITGGGSGGTVCILAQGERGRASVKAIHRKYEEELGRFVKLFE
ncbi:MAG: hypothetical protein HC842_00435 [Cytophagales bacterium]|nr:hypothetical protein [Cytophagales bacterium]